MSTITTTALQKVLEPRVWLNIVTAHYDTAVMLAGNTSSLGGIQFCVEGMIAVYR